MSIWIGRIQNYSTNLANGLNCIIGWNDKPLPFVVDVRCIKPFNFNAVSQLLCFQVWRDSTK
jgi:hypothetical protein